MGTLVSTFTNPGTGGDIQTVPFSLSALSKRYLNIIATTAVSPSENSDVLLSAITIPQCEAITSPLLIVVNSSITDPASVTGAFIGQLAFFQSGSGVLRTWNGTVWVP